MQNLFANDVGNKFPLVMVHGFLGSSLMWEPQIQDLKKTFRVISPDYLDLDIAIKLKL